MRILIVGVALALVGCARWDYTERRVGDITQPVRVDRVSGRTEALYKDGWRVIGAPSPAPKPVTAEQRAESDRILKAPLRPGETEYERNLRASFASLPDARH